MTRDRKALECEWNGVRFELVDTGGVDLAAGDSLSRGGAAPGARGDRRRRRGGPGGGRPRRAARRRRRAGRTCCARAGVPVSSVANKIDRPADEHLAAEFHGLGLGEPHPGLGGPRPRDGRPARRDRGGGPASEPRPRRGGRVAGPARDHRAPQRRQVLAAQRFLGTERVIVSEQAGTTRDAIDTAAELDGAPLVLVDTAGPAAALEGRRARSTTTPSFAPSARPSAPTSRSSSATPPRGHLRGPPGRRAGDAIRVRDAGRAQQVGRGRAPTSRTPGRGSERRTRLRPPVIVCSAQTGRGVQELLRAAVALADRRAERIPTPELNRFMGDVVAATPAAREARRPAPAPLLRRPDRSRSAAVRRPGQRPAADLARLGLPPREPPA